MPLIIKREEAQKGPFMHAKERLYFTADRSALVGEGDKRAAFLYAAVGDEIPQSAAERFGLVDGGLKPASSSSPKPASRPPAAGTKQAAKKPAASKEQKPAEDKEQKVGEDKAGAGAAADGGKG